MDRFRSYNHWVIACAILFLCSTPLIGKDKPQKAYVSIIEITPEESLVLGHPKSFDLSENRLIYLYQIVDRRNPILIGKYKPQDPIALNKTSVEILKRYSAYHKPNKGEQYLAISKLNDLDGIWDREMSSVEVRDRSRKRAKRFEELSQGFFSVMLGWSTVSQENIDSKVIFGFTSGYRFARHFTLGPYLLTYDYSHSESQSFRALYFGIEMGVWKILNTPFYTAFRAGLNRRATNITFGEQSIDIWSLDISPGIALGLDFHINENISLGIEGNAFYTLEGTSISSSEGSSQAEKDSLYSVMASVKLWY